MKFRDGCPKYIHGLSDNNTSKQLVGVYAGVVEGLEIGYDGGTVFGVCDAEPARGRGENVDACLAAFDELVDNRRYEELALGLVAVLGQEFAKLARAVVEIVWGKAPEVHRHGSLGIDVCRIAVCICVGDVVVGIIAQGGALDHVGEFAVAVDRCRRHGLPNRSRSWCCRA